MTEKQLKKLSRSELLEILIQQTKRNAELEQRISDLTASYEAELEKLRNGLKNTNIAIEEAGSIAQASLKLAGVFEAAELAAGIYLENIKRLEEAMEQKAQQMLEETILLYTREEPTAEDSEPVETENTK